MINDFYTFNPYYKLLVDKYSPILKSRTGWINENQTIAETDMSVRIHPVHAVLFSLFDGKRSLTEVVDMAKCIFDEFESDELHTHIQLFLENESRIGLSYGGEEFIFPKNILVPMIPEYEIYEETYNTNDFIIDPSCLDFNRTRLSHPSLLLLVINTICYTNCCYCYANRKRKIQFSVTIERMKEIIREAKRIGVTGIDITGGEFFLYPNWDILLTELIKNGYNPYISTKVPLLEEDIIKIKNTGLRGFQVSLDSVDSDILTKTLKTKESYIYDIENMLKLTEKHGLSISIHSIITKTTASEENISRLLSFLSNFNNIRDIKIDTAAKSLYLSQNEFNLYKINALDIDVISKSITDSQSLLNTSCLCAIESNKYALCNTKEFKEGIFSNRGKCSGNTEALVILPNGEVTICEELYWNNNFILGDINKQGVQEIWDSAKAINLYNISKDKIHTNSACKNCDVFDDCRQGSGVCWRDIINAYGVDNWSFPDPRCPKAPPLTNNIIYGD